MWENIEQEISRAIGERFSVVNSKPMDGGCINRAVCLIGEGHSFFVKTSAAASLRMFEAEVLGLTSIRESQTVRAPEPIAVGANGEHSWLAIEYLNLAQTDSPSANTSLGEQLAAMHKSTATAFGGECDNTIGLTPQPNPWTKDWVSFLRQHRIGFQLTLAQSNGLPGHIVDDALKLKDELHLLFCDYQPRPSLLHGDLWGGNWGTMADNRPVIFDPAVYYGDRETDLAMTELFDGFDGNFYAAYNANWPLDPGYSVRRDLYQLYHVLNHFNLFGSGYAAQSAALIQRLRAELK